MILSKLNLIKARRSEFFSSLFLTGAMAVFASGCQQMEKIKEPKPLAGADVSEHTLADGKIGLKLKVTGLTSTVWFTTEIVNKSSEPVGYSAKDLISFDHQECVREFDVEENKAGVLQPNERVLLRYSFSNLAKQKRSPEYENCRFTPTKLQVSGLTLGNAFVEPIRVTIE